MEKISNGCGEGGGPADPSNRARNSIPVVNPDSPVTAQPRHEGERASTAAYRAAVQAFGEIAGALNETRDRDALLFLIARRVCELVGIERCSVYLKDDESGLYRGQVGWSPAWERGELPNDQERVKRLVCGTERDAFTREIVATRRPVVVADTRSDPRPIRSAMRAWGIISMLGVPMVLGGEVIGLIFLDNANEPHVFTPTETEIASTFADLAGIVISQAQLTMHLRRSVQTVTRQNDVLRRAAEADDTLSGLVLAGATVAEIAEAVSELTGKPCEIYDASHRRLAAALPASGQPFEARVGFETALRSHPAVSEALEGLGEKGSGVIGPFLDAGLPHRFLCSSIAMRDDVWGALVIVEHGSRFGPLDAHIARRAAMNVALELAAERRAARAEWDARASLAGELISGAGDAASVRRRAEYLGIDLESPHVVCLVGARPDTALPAAADVSGAFAQIGRRVLATAVAEGVIVILELDSEAPPLPAVAAAREDVEQALAKLDMDAALLAAISSRCTSAEGYARAYEEDRQVMSCVRSFAGQEGSFVLTADDLGPGRLFLASTNRAEAERFTDDALGPLLRSEDPARGDLLRTLEVFFQHSRNIRSAAQQLGVHENTIRYRLARIQQLTGLAVGSDSSDELTAHLALLVLRVTRMASGKRQLPG